MTQLLTYFYIDGVHGGAGTEQGPYLALMGQVMMSVCKVFRDRKDRMHDQSLILSDLYNLQG